MSTNSYNQNDYKLYYWLTLLALFIFSLIAGVWGFQNYFNQHGEEYNWFRSIYRTIQLFALEGGDLKSPIPWELQLTRFGAPLVTALTVIIALLAIFKEQWIRMKIARMKNHVVIIGFGTKGKNVMEETLRKKGKVLVVEKDSLNPNLVSIKPPGSLLLLGDANSKEVFIKARITKAQSVFLLMGDDTTQVNACLQIYKLILESRRSETIPLNCIMHLQNQDFLTILRSHNMVRDTHDGFTLNIFNIFENSARELFEDNPPDQSGITLNSKYYVRIIIFGFGKAGEALALQTALTGHYLNDKKPQIIIIDRLAEEKEQDFRERYPTFTNFCDLKYLALEANNPQIIQHLVKILAEPHALNTLVLCFDNKTHNLLLGIQLESLKFFESDKSPNIFVRTNDNETFTTFSSKLKPYGLPSKVCSYEAIMRGDMDRIAQARHSNYINRRKNNSDFGIKESDVSWENLSQDYKDSNRKAADHIGVKMRSIGCEIVSNDDPRPSAKFTKEEIELLSKLEHSRWYAERSLAGWTFDNQSNDQTRKTPYLVEWSKLPNNIQDYDKETIIDIPAVLGLIGMKVVRQEKKTT